MINVGGYRFALITEIRPDHDPGTGAVFEYDPVASGETRRRHHHGSIEQNAIAKGFFRHRHEIYKICYTIVS